MFLKKLDQLLLTRLLILVCMRSVYLGQARINGCLFFVCEIFQGLMFAIGGSQRSVGLRSVRSLFDDQFSRRGCILIHIPLKLSVTPIDRAVP